MITYLYNNILNGKYKKTNTAFKSGLTKVQIFKLKKIISEEEFIFIEEFGDVDLNTNI